MNSSGHLDQAWRDSVTYLSIGAIRAMCGIAGSVGDPSGLDHVSALTQRLAHRGPDSSATQTLGPEVFVGHTRLRIIDLSPGGDQPIFNEDRTIAVVFNGEIYNHRALRGELERLGHSFGTNTDTEVIVHLYEEHGDRFVERLHGMFAFALWDANKQRLLLGRDRLGIKPLYLRRVGASLHFASETRPLAAGATVNRRSLSDLLRLGWVPGPSTIWNEIDELPAAHLLSWAKGETKQWRYVDEPDYAVDAPDATVDGLRTALIAAMETHLSADVEVGLFLSSGLDSATLAQAAVHAGFRPRALTVAFDHPSSEHVEAAAIATKLGLPHEVVWADAESVPSRIDEFFAAMDQPTVDGLNTWVVTDALRRSGLKVGVSGVGGDELFGGYSTYWHAPRLSSIASRARYLPRPIRTAPGFAVGMVPRLCWSRTARAAEALEHHGLWGGYAATRGVFSERQLQRILPGAVEGFASLGSSVRELEMTQYIRDQLLHDTDVMSMAHSTEVRVPLLDDAVVSTALRMQVRLGERDAKFEVLSGLFGPVAPVRPKQTFTLPIADWLRGPLEARVAAMPAALESTGLGFDRKGLDACVAAWGMGRIRWRPIWMLVVLAETLARTGRLAE